MARLTTWVDPFIGVDAQGNTLCGPHLPHSLVRLGPDSVRPHKTNGYKTDLPLLRFSHTHVSGTGGGGRYGNVGVIPFSGVPRIQVDPFEKRDERAEPGYYRVTLKPAGIRAELTSTPRVGVHRYTFPGGPANVMLEAGALIQRDFRPGVVCLHSQVEWVGDRAVMGQGAFRGGWGHDFPYQVFFYAEFERTPDRRLVATDQGIMAPGTHAEGTGARALAHFKTGGVVGLRVGVSFVSVAIARAALERECAGKTFAVVRREASDIWERALERIRVEGGTDDERRIFYTFFTRLLCLPTDLGVDDENPLWRSGIRHYWDFYCLWDSVRNANSLITLFDPDLEVAFLNSALDVADHTGWLVDAWIAGHSAQIQGGSSADILFCEARLKGLEGLDYDKALNYMLKNNRVESPDPWLYGRYLPHYRDKGYVPDGVINCVSRHLEYTYQDWCAGRLAAALGRTADAQASDRSAAKVWNLWRDDLRAFAPRHPDGTWVNPFDPMTCRPDSWNDPYFYEGPSFGWSFNVQHDFAGLVRRHGGGAAFARHLDRFLALKHPCKEVFMHIPWLYTYAGQPARTVEAVWRTLHRYYTTARNGLPDNEDMGCHSAFYMGGAMGLYPIMGQDLYILSAPFFRRVDIQLGRSGRALTIEAPGAGEGRLRHIRGVTLNGKPLERGWLRHAEIAQGGTLRFDLGPKPTDWGRRRPPPNGV